MINDFQDKISKFCVAVWCNSHSILSSQKQQQHAQEEKEKEGQKNKKKEKYKKKRTNTITHASSAAKELPLLFPIF